MKYLRLFEDFNLSYEERQEILKSDQGFNSREESENHLNYLQNQFEYEKSIGRVKLYRVLFVESIEDINTEDFGRHWSTEMYDKEGVDIIRETSDAGGEAYIIIADFHPSDIDYKSTLHAQMLYPWEYEYYIKKGAKPIGYKIMTFEKYDSLSYEESSRLHKEEL